MTPQQDPTPPLLRLPGQMPVPVEQVLVGKELFGPASRSCEMTSKAEAPSGLVLRGLRGVMLLARRYRRLL